MSSIRSDGWERLQRLTRAFVWEQIIKLSEFSLVHRNSRSITPSASETTGILFFPFLAGLFQHFLPSYWLSSKIDPYSQELQHFLLSPFPFSFFLVLKCSAILRWFSAVTFFVLLLWMSYNIRYTLLFDSLAFSKQFIWLRMYLKKIL